VFRAGGDVSTWQRVLATLRQHVLDCVGENPQLRSIAEQGFYDALLLSANVVGREEARRRDALGALLRTAVQTGNALVSARESGDLGRTLVEHLGSLTIPSCYLALFANEQQDEARLVVGFDQALTSEETEPVTFASRDLALEQLLPDDRHWVYVHMPLITENETLGFALLEYKEDDGVLFEILRDQFSAALSATLRSETAPA
jgi:hypothetical protein